MLLMIAIVLVRPEAKDGDIQLKAEFLITMEWDGDDNSDVDLFVKLPNKEIVFYGRSDAPMASLDRDDQGSINDSLISGDGARLLIKENWEHITIRKSVPGTYVVNVLMFHKRFAGKTKVSVKIEKLNPYRLIHVGSVDLNESGDEKTILKFKIDSSGNVVQKIDTPDKFTNEVRIKR
jgi:hypothetical protein